MRNFLALQYRLGHLTMEQLRGLAPRWITPAQAEEIIAAEQQD